MKKQVLTFLLIGTLCLPKAEAGLGYAAAGCGVLAGVGLVAGAAKVALTKKDREILKGSYSLVKEKRVKKAVLNAVSILKKDPVLAGIVVAEAILVALALGCLGVKKCQAWKKGDGANKNIEQVDKKSNGKGSLIITYGDTPTSETHVFSVEGDDGEFMDVYVGGDDEFSDGEDSDDEESDGEDNFEDAKEDPDGSEEG